MSLQFIILECRGVAYLPCLFSFCVLSCYLEKSVICVKELIIYSKISRKLGKERHGCIDCTGRMCTGLSPISHLLSPLVLQCQPTSMPAQTMSFKAILLAPYQAQTLHFSCQNFSALLNPSLESERGVYAQCLEDRIHLCLVQENATLHLLERRLFASGVGLSITFDNLESFWS